MRSSVGIILGTLLLCVSTLGCAGARSNSSEKSSQEISLSEQNLIRAIELADNAISSHFSGEGMAMSRFYNPFTAVGSDEKGSVWMYTSAIEAVNAILNGLKAHKAQGNAAFFNDHYKRYEAVLQGLYENADYYLGTFELVSYTQTKVWSVYGVHRASAKGHAKVAGIENVYDDQMWLVRELLESYHLTGSKAYLEKAEYLTEYVLDGWDCTRDANGEENGGISWGPGYVTKHSCSNGPMVSPLVWLHELYKDKDDSLTYRYIDPGNGKTRKAMQVKKSDYYLDFAKKIYEWQKKWLLRPDGVYDDMMGGCEPGSPQTETIKGLVYRKGITCQDRIGPAITYNSGTMLSGAADLYRVTGEDMYLKDALKLSDASFSSFAKFGQTKEGYYAFDLSGFRNWFNGVLMRAYVDIYPDYKDASDYINAFQKNLDYGYENFLHNGFLPSDLLAGWHEDVKQNQTEGMFSFAFAAEYALLSRYELEK